MATAMEVASLLQRPRGIQDWWKEIEESMHFARARPEFQKNIQKLVTIFTFTVVVLFAGALLLHRHAPLDISQVLVSPPPDADLMENPPEFVVDRLQRPDWQARHERLVKEAEEGGFDVMYLGDSITEGWVETSVDKPRPEYAGNKAIWDELNKDLGVSAANFGIAGDRVLHLLWRMQKGEFPARPPKVLILCIGVNDLLSHQSVEETFGHMKRLLDFFAKSAPRMSIALLSVLPTAYGSTLHLEPAKNNERLQQLEGGRIHFVDCTSVFADGNGVKAGLFQEDLLHLNEDGYREWGLCIKPEVQRLLSKHRRKRWQR